MRRSAERSRRCVWASSMLTKPQSRLSRSSESWVPSGADAAPRGSRRQGMHRVESVFPRPRQSLESNSSGPRCSAEELSVFAECRHDGFAPGLQGCRLRFLSMLSSSWFGTTVSSAGAGAAHPCSLTSIVFSFLVSPASGGTPSVLSRWSTTSHAGRGGLGAGGAPERSGGPLTQEGVDGVLRWEKTEGGPLVEYLRAGWTRHPTGRSPAGTGREAAEGLAGYSQIAQRSFSLGRETGDRALGEERGPVAWAAGAKRREESGEAGTKV